MRRITAGGVMLNQETAKAARTDSVISFAHRDECWLLMPLLSISGAHGGRELSPVGSAGGTVCIEPMNCLASREYDAVIFVGPHELARLSA